MEEEEEGGGTSTTTATAAAAAAAPPPPPPPPPPYSIPFPNSSSASPITKGLLLFLPGHAFAFDITLRHSRQGGCYYCPSLIYRVSS